MKPSQKKKKIEKSKLRTSHHGEKIKAVKTERLKP